MSQRTLSRARTQRTKTDRLAYPSIARKVFYLALTASPFTTFRVGSLTVGDLLLVFSLGLTVTERSSRGIRARGVPSALSQATVWLIAVGGTIASYNAVASDESMLAVARIVVVVSILPWHAITLLKTERQVRHAVGWLAVGGAGCGAGAILQGSFGVVIPGSEVTDAGRFPGFTQNVSDAGGITCVTVLLCVCLSATANSSRERLIWSLLLVVATAGLILSGSVSGMLAVAVGGFALFALGVIRFRVLALTAALAYVALWLAARIQSGVGALSPDDRFRQAVGLTDGGRYDTAESRVDVFAIAIHRILENPLVGAGLDPVSSVIATGYAPHNILIAAFFEGGILVFVGVLLALSRPFRGVLNKSGGLFVKYLAAANLGAVTFAMTTPSLYNRYLWIPLALLITAGLIQERESARSRVSGLSQRV